MGTIRCDTEILISDLSVVKPPRQLRFPGGTIVPDQAILLRSMKDAELRAWLKAWRLINDWGVSQFAIAKRLGISKKRLHSWLHLVLKREIAGSVQTGIDKLVEDLQRPETFNVSRMSQDEIRRLEVQVRTAKVKARVRKEKQGRASKKVVTGR